MNEYENTSREGLYDLLEEATARISELEADNVKLIDLLRVQNDLLARTHKAYENMTTDEFSIGADRHIRAEVAKFLGMEEA